MIGQRLSSETVFLTLPKDCLYKGSSSFRRRVASTDRPTCRWWLVEYLENREKHVPLVDSEIGRSPQPLLSSLLDIAQGRVCMSTHRVCETATYWPTIAFDARKKWAAGTVHNFTKAVRLLWDQSEF
jgi:hypothetical protein